MKPQTILITGVNGFVGQHLAHELYINGARVIGVGREPEPQESLAGLIDKYIIIDLADESSVRKLQPELENIDAIINLAGIATTKNDPEQIESIMKINVEVHRLLYRALLNVNSKARIVAISTGLVYESNQPVPYSENSKLLLDTDETNGYVRSKLRVEDVAKQYAAKGLDIVIARPFNHTGPGQGLGFFIPDQIAKIRQAMSDGIRMELGESFDFWRDFTDVRDIVKAYSYLTSTGKGLLRANIYNISSGVSVYGRDLFRMLAAELQFTNFTLSSDASSPEITHVAGDSTLLRNDTRWAPAISLQQTLHDAIS